MVALVPVRKGGRLYHLFPLRGFKELEKIIKGIHFTDGIEETRFDPVAA